MQWNLWKSVVWGSDMIQSLFLWTESLQMYDKEGFTAYFFHTQECNQSESAKWIPQ